MCLLIVSAFTLLFLAVGSMSRMVVESDVGIGEKPAFEGALPCGMTFAPRGRGIRGWVASHPSWRNPTFTMGCICWAKRRIHS